MLEISKECAKALLPAKQKYVQCRTYDAYDSQMCERKVEHLKGDIEMTRESIKLFAREGKLYLLVSDPHNSHEVQLD